ncbi:hypothetical protein DFJ74DRAFT_770291 [Hyaloraphidium curvatum]|nr:hypothetical protein DFJ74DRAFT_770291 [Hyaloraphidium curvatum]
MELRGARALVTGGTEGMGREIVQLLLSLGAKVAILNRNEANGAAAVAALEAVHGAGSVCFVRCDVCDPDSVRGAFDAAAARLGGLDVVVANAGFVGDPAPGILRGARDDAWMRVVQGNLVGFMLLGRLAATHWLRAKAPGVFVAVSSLGGIHAGNPQERIVMAPSSGFSYAACKSAQITFVETLQATLDAMARGKSPVRCAVVLPGLVWTPMVQKEGLRPGDPPRTKEAFAKAIGPAVELLGGYTPPRAVAEAVVKCVRDQSVRGGAFVVAGDAGEAVPYPAPDSSMGRYVRGKASL